MKIKVVTLKDICKYLAKISLVFGVVAVFANFFYTRKNVNGYFAFNSNKFLSALKQEILVLKSEENNKINFSSKQYMSNTLNNEFSMFKTVATTNNSNILANNTINDESSDEQNNTDNMQNNNTNLQNNEIKEVRNWFKY